MAILKRGITGCGDAGEVKSGPGFQKAANSALARKTLERMQAVLENPGTIGGGGHFPEIVFGRLLQVQGKRQWTTLG